MTRKELLELPKADQSENLMSWDGLIVVPTDKKYEDTEWRVFAIIGVLNGTPTHYITCGDIVVWDSHGLMPNISMHSDSDCTHLYCPGYKMQAYNGGGTISFKIVNPQKQEAC